MADSPVVVNHERLADFIASVLEALTMSPKNARLTADLMVRTDLRGVDPRPRRSVTGAPSGIPVAPVLAQQCNEIAARLRVKPLT
jgi:hypothetical protein